MWKIIKIIYCSNCGAILEKLKSLLPVPTISHHDEQPRQDSNEETEEQSGEVEEAYSSPDAKGDFEQPEDIPKTSSFDNLKEEDDGLSSDESFVKIDDKEFAEGAQNTDLSQESGKWPWSRAFWNVNFEQFWMSFAAQGEDRSRSDDDEDTLNQDKWMELVMQIASFNYFIDNGCNSRHAYSFCSYS